MFHRNKESLHSKSCSGPLRYKKVKIVEVQWARGWVVLQPKQQQNMQQGVSPSTIHIPIILPSTSHLSTSPPPTSLQEETDRWLGRDLEAVKHVRKHRDKRSATTWETPERETHLNKAEYKQQQPASKDPSVATPDPHIDYIESLCSCMLDGVPV